MLISIECCCCGILVVVLVGIVFVVVVVFVVFVLGPIFDVGLVVSLVGPRNITLQFDQNQVSDS